MLDDLKSALKRLDRSNSQNGAPQPRMMRPERDDRSPQYHPGRHPFRHRADRLAVFLHRAADGEAAAAEPEAGRARKALARRRPAHAPGSTAPAARRRAATRPRPRPAAAAGRPGVSRDAAIAATPRVKIETPRVSGSISLKGARIDDVALKQYRETVDPKSPAIVLFSPSQTANPYYAEFGWVPATGSTHPRCPTRTRCGSRKARQR